MSHQKRILYIPDLHFPFCNMDLLQEVYNFNWKFKADQVIQLGDLVDFYSFSRFLKDPSAPSLSQETKETKKQIQQFCRWFPNVIALTGNHEKRLAKRAKDSGISSEWLKDILTVLDAPKGLRYHPKDYLDLGNIMVAHGHLTNMNARKAHMDFYGKNVVFGHLHSALGVEFNPKTEKKIWGMSCSCIVDVDSVAMQYQEQNWKNIVCGFGYSVGNKPYVECLS